MFVDEIKIKIKAGDGGDGVVRWNREKFKPKGGPSGGDGGNGGDVYIRGVRDLSMLERYAHVKELAAERGEDGGAASMFGAAGEDLYVDFPVGAKVTNKVTGEVFQLTEHDQTEHILEGGHGGRGNERFKSSVNQTPQEWTPGGRGEEAEFLIELELIADVGLIGLPSAGKSTLITELTNARSKVAAYHFTTLEPHLGDLYGYIIADIPGLIEGAAEGKGLGHTFLRHVKKTSLLLHCISLESEDVAHDYTVIRNELDQYDRSLTEKPEIIVLTKSDLVSEEEVKAARVSIEKQANAKQILIVSIVDDGSIKNLSDTIVAALRLEE